MLCACSTVVMKDREIRSQHTASLHSLTHGVGPLSQPPFIVACVIALSSHSGSGTGSRMSGVDRVTEAVRRFL